MCRDRWSSIAVKWQRTFDRPQSSFAFAHKFCLANGSGGIKPRKAEENWGKLWKTEGKGAAQGTTADEDRWLSSAAAALLLLTLSESELDGATSWSPSFMIESVWSLVFLLTSHHTIRPIRNVWHPTLFRDTQSTTGRLRWKPKLDRNLNGISPEFSIRVCVHCQQFAFDFGQEKRWKVKYDKESYLQLQFNFWLFPKPPFPPNRCCILQFGCFFSFRPVLIALGPIR